MKKMLVTCMAFALCAGAAFASGGVGVFGSYLDSDDLGPGYGGGIKFKADLAEYFALDLRASCLTQFDDWDGDDDLFVIPLEAGLLLNLPLGNDIPISLYGGGGGGYAIIPEADDVDLDDSFCFYGMGGVELGLGEGASLFVEAQYRILEVEGAEEDGVDVDFDENLEFTGLSLNAGLMLRF